VGSDEGDEPGGGELGVGDEPAGLLVEDGDLLVAARTDRMDQPAPRGELVNERPRDQGEAAETTIAW
jgi:hypothetical protein